MNGESAKSWSVIHTLYMYDFFCECHIHWCLYPVSFLQYMTLLSVIFINEIINECDGKKVYQVK